MSDAQADDVQVLSPPQTPLQQQPEPGRQGVLSVAMQGAPSTRQQIPSGCAGPVLQVVGSKLQH